MAGCNVKHTGGDFGGFSIEFKEEHHSNEQCGYSLREDIESNPKGVFVYIRKCVCDHFMEGTKLQTKHFDKIKKNRTKEFG